MPNSQIAFNPDTGCLEIEPEEQASRFRRVRKQNARQYGQVFYGLHMAPGVCDYERPDGSSERVLVTQEAIARMNRSFSGKPLFVLHKNVPSASEGGDLSNLESEDDGIVVESFFNEADGNTWVKFMAQSDAALDAIQRGWKLSNSYLPTEVAGPGTWHNVPFDEQVLDGIFEHMALVPDPRYEETAIFTPEEFREYNEQKKHELRRLQNSKKRRKGDRLMPFKGFKLFNRTRVTDARRLRNALVELPDGEEVPFSRIVRRVAEDLEEEKQSRRNTRGSSSGRRSAQQGRRNDIGEGGTAGAAVMDQEVAVGDRMLTVRDLISLYMELDSSRANASDDDEDDEEEGQGKRKKNARRSSAGRAGAASDPDDDSLVISVGRRSDLEDLDEEEDLEPTSRRRNRRDRLDGGDLGDQDPRQLGGSDQDPDLDEKEDLDAARGRRNARGRDPDPDPELDGEEDMDREEDLEEQDLEDLSRANRGPRARANASAGSSGRRAQGKGGKPGKRGGSRGNARGADGRKLVELTSYEQQMLREHRRSNADSLRNARDSFEDGIQDEKVIDTMSDQVSRGLQRYGAPMVPGQLPGQPEPKLGQSRH